MLIESIKKHDEEGDSTVPLLRTRVPAKLRLLPLSRRTRQKSPPSNDRVAAEVLFSFGWVVPRVDSLWRVVEKSQKDR